MARHYRLEGRKAVPCSMMEWATSFDEKSRRVAYDTVGDVNVSTVFLGLDHNIDPDGPPMIFETMIFGGKHDKFQDRCSTYDEAEAMHARALALVRGK